MLGARLLSAQNDPTRQRDALDQERDLLVRIKELGGAYSEVSNTLLLDISGKLHPKARPDLYDIIGGANATYMSVYDSVWEGVDDIPKAPISDDVLQKLTVPVGYTLTFEYGITKTARNKVTPIAPRLVIPVGQAFEQGTNRVYIELMWWSYAAGRWLRRAFLREELLVSNTLAKLGSYDIPVTSQSARKIVGWFDDFLSANANLPSDVIQTHQGWGSWENKPYFVLGRRVYGHAPPGLKVEPVEGMDQVMGAVRTEGSIDTQFEMLKRLSKYPVSFAAMMVSAAAPMLKIIDCPSFIFDIGDTTSSGKTTTLIACGSFYGFTSDRETSLLDSWNTTRVGAERHATHLANLPYLLNESQLITNSKDAQSIVHMITENTTKGRGTIRGVERKGTWHLPVISCGEASLIERLPGAGVSARTVAVMQRPFGEDSPVNRDSADFVRKCCSESYGWLGHMLIKYLLDIQDEHDSLQQEYIVWKNKLQAAADGAIGYRVAQYLAAMSLARDVMIEATQIHFGSESDFPEYYMTHEDWMAWCVTHLKIAQIDPIEARFRRMIVYALTQPSTFLGVGGSSPVVVNGIMSRDYETVHLSEDFVIDFLSKKLGDSAYAGTIRQWLRLGYLVKKRDYGSYTRTHSASKTKVVGWSVPFEQINNIVGEDADFADA